MAYSIPSESEGDRGFEHIGRRRDERVYRLLECEHRSPSGMDSLGAAEADDRRPGRAGRVLESREKRPIRAGFLSGRFEVYLAAASLTRTSEGDGGSNQGMDTSATLRCIQLIASSSVRPKALAAVGAREPMIMKGHDERDFSTSRLLHEREPEVQQMLNVNDIRSKLVEDLANASSHLGVEIRMLEASPESILRERKDFDPRVLCVEDRPIVPAGIKTGEEYSDRIFRDLASRQTIRIDFDASRLLG